MPCVCVSFFFLASGIANKARATRKARGWDKHRKPDMPMFAFVDIEKRCLKNIQALRKKYLEMLDAPDEHDGETMGRLNYEIHKGAPQ